MNVTLLQKPGPLTTPHFGANLENEFSQLQSNLTARAKFVGTSKKGWTRAQISGEDEEIYAELLVRKFGVAHENFDEVELQAVYDGVAVDSNTEDLEVDLGIDTPHPLNATIPLSALRAQLADGRQVAYRDITESYCLSPGMKISIRITDKNPRRIEGWLSDEEINRFSDWLQTGLDRIIVFDCFKEQLESAIAKAQLSRDIISVESVALTTHVAICKLGTDAIGLMPKLGSCLRKRALKPFIPKRIIARCRPW